MKQVWEVGRLSVHWERRGRGGRGGIEEGKEGRKGEGVGKFEEYWSLYSRIVQAS